jgi:oligosaccharide repeat unit polymerase
MLAPAILGLWRRTFRLLHPAVFFPLLLVYQSGVPVFCYLSTGEPMLKSSESYLDGPAYYAYPLLIQFFGCVAYFVGLRLSLGSVVPGRADRADLHREMRVMAARPSSVFAVGIALLSLAVIAKLFEYGMFGGVAEALNDPYGFIHSNYGFYWLHVIFTSAYIIPSVLFLASPWQGLIAFPLTLAASLLCLSKGNALRMVLPLILFGVPSVLRRWRPVVGALVAVALFITPVFVGRYRGVGDEFYASDAFASLLNREYSFEFFCLINGSLRSEPLPAERESYLVGAALELIPRQLWPDKPLSKNLEMGAEWAPEDYNYRTFIAPHFLGVLYLDGGLLGIALGAGALGFCLGAWYRRARRLTLTGGTRFPMLLFLCSAAVSKGLVDGAMANYVMQMLFMLGMLTCWRWLAGQTRPDSAFGGSFARPLAARMSRP